MSLSSSNRFFSIHHLQIIFVVACSLLGCKKADSLTLNPENTIRDTTQVSYLALGDSYTIGEMVSADQNYPNQVTQYLRSRGRQIITPQIIARTGWTTEDLLQAINASQIHASFSLVTLLIGVNNQYQGGSISTFNIQFTELVNEAISFSGNHPNHVVVLSIPDWGVSPFAISNGVDSQKVGQQIDLFNQAAKEISDSLHVNYLDITPFTLDMGRDPSLVAADGLHPSGKEYAIWTSSLGPLMDSLLSH